ncbi:MAG TPA: helix-turn-helix domain-containing protein [Blastocatellia bacterium]|nr:helix-turn-helix domain-containing protein [Blastocatellia bacterium]
MNEDKANRSHCPIAYTLDTLGDKWTLVVIRDLALFGKRYYKELLESEEGIATNILSDRLQRLERERIITKRHDPENRSKIIYNLTEKGIDLVPLLVDIIEWGAKYDPCTVVTSQFRERLEKDRLGLIQQFQSKLRSEIQN